MRAAAGPSNNGDAAMTAATFPAPIVRMSMAAVSRSASGRRWRLADAHVRLGRRRVHVLVDVVDARLTTLLGRELDARRRRAPLDRLDLVVHRAVRAVDGQLVAIERPSTGFAQRPVGMVTLVTAVVDELPAGAAPERQDDLLVVFRDLDLAHVRDHGPRDH